MNRIHLSSEQSARCLGWGIRFFLSAALSGCQVLSSAPFALGFLSAAGSGANGIAALCGMASGALLFMDFQSGLSFMATGILIFASRTALEGLPLLRRSWFLPGLSAGLFFAVRLIYLIQSPRLATGLFPALAVAVLTALSARLYPPLLAEERDDRQIPLLFLALSLVVGLTPLQLPGEVSVGRILASTLTLYAAYAHSAGIGAACGVCIGLGMDLAGGTGGLFYASAYGLMGLGAGFRAQCGRWNAAFFYLLATVALLLPVTAEEGLPLLGEALGGALFFLLLPGRLFGGKRVKPRAVSEEGSLSLLETLRQQLNQSAAVFRDLYDSFSRSSGSTEENPAVVFDRAAEQQCRGCVLCDICWKREYNVTFNALNDATPFMVERGRALAKDFPRHFSDRCIHLPEFLTAVNTELSAFLLRRQYRHQVDEARRSAKGQYAQLSDLLSSTAAHLEPPVQPASVATRLPYTVGAALRPKEGETVSGDSISAFETDQGFLYLILSDGMGTGEEARRESAMTVRLLERFLKAGIEAEAALKTLNSAMSLRSAETGSFTTIDLLRIRLQTGEATLYKYGAAPSYIKHGGRVSRVTGSTLPAGLHTDPSPPDSTRFPLQSDSFVVLISDGIADASQDEWLQNLLAGWQGSDPQSLVSLILAEARRQGRQSDDCGVQILYLPSLDDALREI